MSVSNPPNIQGLVELAQRDGGDIRPSLLRVIADLYVRDAGHTRAEQARFAELVCRLLDTVDSATRRAVAERLADYGATPAVVASRLARDEIAVAEPVLHRSPALGEAALHSILDTCGPAHARAIAARADLPASVAERLSPQRRNPPRHIAMPAADIPAPREPARQRDRALTLALARRFLITGAAERRLILTAMACCGAIEHETHLRRTHRPLAERLEAAALRRRSHEFIQALHSQLGIPPGIGTGILADPSGELFVVLSRALAIPFDVTARMLLFLNPELGRSVQRVYALAGLYEEVLPLAARRLAAAWRELAPPPANRPRPPSARRARDLPAPRTAASGGAQPASRFVKVIPARPAAERS